MDYCGALLPKPRAVSSAFMGHQSLQLLCSSTILIELPNLNIHRDKVNICPNVVLCEGLVPPLAEISEDEKNLTIARWSCVEEEHRLVPRNHLGAGNITSLGPCMCFAFDKDSSFFVPKVEAVWLAAIDANLNCDTGRKMQPLLGKKRLCPILEVPANLGVAFGIFALEWFVCHWFSVQSPLPSRFNRSANRTTCSGKMSNARGTWLVLPV